MLTFFNRAHAGLYMAMLALPMATSAQTTHDVTVSDTFFSPANITIEPGDTVRWTNAPGGLPHDVTADDGSFASVTKTQFTFEVTFNEPSENPYHCTVHGAPGGLGMSGRVSVEGRGGEDSIARFLVEKFFVDGNPAGVEVTLSCNTGLPLEQTFIVATGAGVTPVVTDFIDGALDCVIFEDPVPLGYTVFYTPNEGLPSEGPCEFTGIGFGEENRCDIGNHLNPVDIVVTKEWIDENPQFNPVNIAEATFSCEFEQFFEVAGTLEFFGNGDTDSFSVLPRWDGLTECDVTESIVEGGIEADSSDCQGLSVTPGNGASCTIVNTRLFEGIPTLGKYGQAILVMLVLGLGLGALCRLS